MLRGNLHRRLAEARAEVLRARESLRIVDEQVAFQQGVVDEAETRAVVSATPLADRERREAEQDLLRLRRHRDELGEQVRALVVEQDELLERLLDERTGAG